MADKNDNGIIKGKPVNTTATIVVIGVGRSPLAEVINAINRGAMESGHNKIVTIETPGHIDSLIGRFVETHLPELLDKDREKYKKR